MDRGDLINAVSAIAIVVGLMLVLVELRQSRDIAEAQLFVDLNAAMLADDLAILGEDAAEAMSKECHQPSELTTVDWEVLIAKKRALLRRAVDRLAVQEQGLLTELPGDGITRNVALGYLGTPFGRFVWKSERNWVVRGYPRIAQIFDEALETIPKGGCLWQGEHQEYLEELKKGTL